MAHALLPMAYSSQKKKKGANTEICKNSRLKCSETSVLLLLEFSHQERWFHPLIWEMANGSIKLHGWGTKSSKCQREVSWWWKGTCTFCVELDKTLHHQDQSLPQTWVKWQLVPIHVQSSKQTLFPWSPHFLQPFVQNSFLPLFPF